MRTILFVLLCLFILVQRLSAQPVIVPSPDGQIKVTAGIDNSGQLFYSVKYHEKTVLLDSPFDLQFENMPALKNNLYIKNVTQQAIKESWQRVWGKRKNVLNQCNETILHLEEKQAPFRRLDFIVRAYDDAIALRYVLPAQKSLSDFTLTAERLQFHFSGNHTCWAANYKGYATHQEAEFDQTRITDLIPATPYGCPMLVKVEESVWVALTEANLTDWAGMYLTAAGHHPNTLVTALAPWYDNPSVLVKSATPRHSPWRVIMIADRPGAFLESDIIQNLNEPCEIKDTSWISPGKSAWDRWWCGDYLPDATFKIGMNNETMKYFIDFAAEMGWPYQLVDWLWYGEPFDPLLGSRYMNPKADLTKSIPEVDVPALVKYAAAKGVKLLLWLEWKAVDQQMDRAFPLYEKWGVAGVKIDFMARDDQYMVNFYHRCVKKAAEHHLLVDFHGAYKPTGWSRTYPNVIAREGILGNEYNKWSDRVTPDHCLTVPFTRGMLGEMDFTPGGFRQKSKETFRIVGGDAPSPFVMGTRCFQLAMMVVYESALQVLCDSPYNYRSSPAGLDFLKIVPTTWDDTKVIHGQVGDFITVARRSGDTWYLGSMTDWSARNLEIPLTFLGPGRYSAEIWKDGWEAADYPDRLIKAEKTVTAADVLTAKMASAGGQVAIIRPVR
jgi:alpha-glucosidase